MAERQGHTAQDLAVAVASSRSWRGVLRALGHPPASAGTYRAIRRQVDLLGIDHSHFTGQRRWSDSDLVAAVAAARNWQEVLRLLGLSDASGNLAGLRGHALRLGVSTDHLCPAVPRADPSFTEPPLASHLRVAAPSLAAAWFQLRGYDVLWPQEGCRYDLAVGRAGAFVRIQVKTTTYRPRGAALAQIAGTRQDHHCAYDIGEVDQFFIIDDELNAYLVPYDVVAGLKQISLPRYVEFLVAERGQWLGVPTSRAAPAP